MGTGILSQVLVVGCWGSSPAVVPWLTLRAASQSGRSGNAEKFIKLLTDGGSFRLSEFCN